MQKEYDKIATRLVEILRKFNDGKSLSVSELAEEFNVSERTIQRDLKERFAYFPMEKKNGCYYMAEYALGKLSFNDIKNFATFSGLKELYPSLSDAFIVDVLNTKINPSMHVRSIENFVWTWL